MTKPTHCALYRIQNYIIHELCFKGNDTQKAIRLKKLPVETVNQDKLNVSEKSTAAASPAKDKVSYNSHFGLDCLVDNLRNQLMSVFCTSFICSGNR